MLAVSSLSNSDGRDIAAAVVADESFDGFLGGGVPMLEDIGIDFDEIFLGFDGVDMLPDLGDPDEIFADFSIDGQYGGDEMGKEAKALEVISGGELLLEKKEEGDKGLSQDQKEIASVTTFKENSNYEVSTPDLPSPKTKTEKSSKAKGNQAKRKVKVDWTLELHQRFVHAVELLGLDKAVPSRILELMGNVGLTRHNIASHLQKYRSHRKHLLAREAEAASWRQRQQMYSSTGMAVAAKTETSPWLTPTMAFPPHPPPIQPTYRPLHVWGHPPMDPNLVHMWPKHLQRPPPMPWPLPPSPHLSTWPTQHPRGPNALTNGMPYFPMPLPLPLPLPATRFPSPSVPGIPPHPLYRTDNAVSLKSKQLASPLQSFETHPTSLDRRNRWSTTAKEEELLSKESIDAAIGDVIAKPWLPLPLGLKPPSLEGVITELQKKGISKIPSIT